MSQHLVVANPFTHQIDCFCPGDEQVDFLTFEYGDVIEVTNDRKFTSGNGWYSFIVINNQCSLYIALDDLEQYYRNKQIFSILDLELKINYLHYKINDSLETENKMSFLYYTSELNKLNKLKEKHNAFFSTRNLKSFI